MSINDRLHTKRKRTEDHIRELETFEKAGKRYTITMPDKWFLILGLICDVGWIIQLISGIVYTIHQLNYLLVADMVVLVIGIAFTIYLEKIHEKEIALRYQRKLRADCDRRNFRYHHRRKSRLHCFCGWRFHKCTRRPADLSVFSKRHPLWRKIIEFQLAEH